MMKYLLKDLLEIKNGRDHKDLKDGNIPVFGSGGLMRYVDTSIYNEESILLPRKGSLDNIQYTNKPFWTVDTLYYTIVNKEKAEPYFLYHYLKQLDLSNLNSGTGVPSMTFGAYYGVEINLPDLTTQKSIASILSALDDKIELNNQINAELEAMAKTLYDYWFVQFDFPFDFAQGKPDKNGKTYKSSGGKMVFNKKLKREIPEGWEVKRIQEIAKTGSGGTPKSTKREYYESGSIPWINSGELNNPFIVNTSNFITKMGMKNSSAKLFPKNTILMAMYGATAGKTSIVSFEVTTNQAICAIIPKKGILLYYLKYSLDHLYNYLVNLSSGSARDNLSQNKIQKLEIIIPSEKTLSTFSEEIKPFFEKIENNLKQNQELAALRDWLLPMLMNGQVTSASSVTDGSATEIGDKDYKTETTYAQAAEDREEYGE